MQLLNSSRTKSLLLVIESLVLCMIVHAVGGFFIAPIISDSLNSVPWVTISMLSSSSISPILAAFYLWKRAGFVPKLVAINKEWLLNSLAAIVLAWFIAFVSILSLGNSDAFANEIFSIENKNIFGLTLLILVIWGPLIEEIFFRGFIFEIIRKTWSNLFSLLATSLLFAAFHGIFGGIGPELIFIFLYSAVFTIAYIQCGLVGSTLVHCFVNSYLSFVFLGSYSR